jgi:hypothetical protein
VYVDALRCSEDEKRDSHTVPGLPSTSKYAQDHDGGMGAFRAERVRGESKHGLGAKCTPSQDGEILTMLHLTSPKRAKELRTERDRGLPH